MYVMNGAVRQLLLNILHVAINVARSQTVCPAIDPSHFLWCGEDSTFLFRPLHPDASDTGAKGVLPDDPDQLDTEEYDELQVIYESVNIGSC